MIYYVTFYSYKGGVGRTLALVNTAYSLVARGKKVLIWDLDLEAPSLLQVPQFNAARKRVTGGTVDVLAAPETDTAKQVAGFIVPVDRGIWLLPAGTDDLKYPERYASVPFDRLFGPDSEEGSRRFEQMRQAIETLPAETRPDVVLIDSRTGLTDLGAICTVQLPNTVVLVYTMNEQGAFGAHRMLSNIVRASERLRHPEHQIKTLLVASLVPTEEDAKLVEERREQLRKKGLKPDFEIPFRRALLLQEEVYATGQSDPESALEFGRLADKLLEIAPGKVAPPPSSLERTPDSRHERGRKFEDKVAEVLRLMDMEVEPNTIASGRQTDMLAHGKSGLQETHYVVECKDHQKPTGVDDIDSLHARVAAFQRKQPAAQGLLVSAKGFTAEARGHAADLPIILKTYDELLDQLINLGPYNATLIQDVAGQTIERLYVEQDVYPDENPKPVALFEHVDRWMADPESTFLTILGDYGTGKTWFTRMQAYRQAQKLRGDASKERQPVRIDLRTVAKAIDLENILFYHFQKETGRAINPKAFLHLLEEGRFLLIFDGFDEMATQGDWGVTLENFRQLTRAAAGHAKVLLTCRTHYFRDQAYVQELFAGRPPDLSERGTDLYREISGRRGYKLAYLRGFSDTQINAYIDRACGDRAEGIRKILAGEPRLQEIANRPILLEIIVKSAPKLVELGKEITVANLYEAYTEDWFTREDWRLRITRERRRELVEALAFQLWREPNARLHHTALRQVIEPLLNDRAYTVRDLEDADREIRTATFLTRDAEGNYGFSHRSFLEFFLASWIRRKFLAGEFALALKHPLLTPPVLQFLEEFTERKVCEAAVRSVLEAAYAVEASENALELHARPRMSQLRGAHLAGARLAGFQLAGVDLNDADLTGADLAEAVLSCCGLTGAALCGANLERASLFAAWASRADFSGANLQGADLGHAILESANFSAADLSFASLSETRTEGAVWDGAKLFGTAGPGRPTHARAVGVLPCVWPRAIAFHPNLPLIAVADTEGVWVIDSVLGLLRRHLAHAGATSVAWEPVGGRLASGSADGTVRMWDVEQGRLLRTLKDHGGRVHSMAWDREGRRLASACDDEMVRVWDADQGRLLRTLEGHSSTVWSVAWDGNGRQLASGSDDKTVRVWNAEQGQLLRTLEGHSKGVRSVAWDPEGRRLASGSEDQTVRVWDAEQGQLLRTLEGHRGEVLSVAWSQEGGRLASGSDDRAVRVWDADQGQLLSTLEGHMSEVLSLAWGPEGRLASTSDHTLRVWDAKEGQLLRTFELHVDFVVSVAWDQEGRRLASGSSNQTVQVWDAERGALLRTLEGHSGLVTSVAWDRQGHRLASGSIDQTVRVWDVERGQLMCVLEGHAGIVSSVAWDAAGLHLVSASQDKTVRVWGVEQCQLLGTFKGDSGSSLSIVWGCKGRSLASGSADGAVRVWDAEQGQLLYTLTGHGGPVASVAWDPEGRRLASGSSDRTVRVWDAEQGQLLATLEGHGGMIRSVAWDGEGRRLASGSDDTTVRVWDGEGGQLVRTLEGHGGRVFSVAWNGDGRRLASSSADNTIRIWDVETGECLQIIHMLPDGGWLTLFADGKFRANEAGKRHFMFADGWALYPASAFPDLELP
jgi:WD40 repeat protein/MinD-like ATPase involved in chromosome partitioning or flagellar assembly